LWRTVSNERDLTLEQGKCVRIPPPEEEGAAQTVCDELTVTPIARLPAGGGGRETGSEAEPEKKGGVGGRCFKIWMCFSLSYSDLNGDKLPFLPKFSLFCP